MSFVIRPARPGEGALVLQLIRELAAYEKLSHKVDADEAMIEAALFGAGATQRCDIAEWNGEVAGQALWFTNFSTFRGRNGLYLEDLYVRPAFRGRGIGRALLARLARTCAENGWPRMEWVVLDWNRPAISFYRALGAGIAEDWRLCRLDGEALARLAAEAPAPPPSPAPSPGPLHIAEDPAPAEADVRRIDAGLDAYNAGFLPGYDLAPQPRYILARDASGACQGGLRYVHALDWLFVEWLWLAEPYRRQGAGTQLLEAAEAQARAAGRLGVYLDTFGFQAPEFYLKRGYLEFGRLPGAARGWDRVWLMKRV